MSKVGFTTKVKATVKVSCWVPLPHAQGTEKQLVFVNILLLATDSVSMQCQHVRITDFLPYVFVVKHWFACSTLNNPHTKYNSLLGAFHC